MDIKNNVRHVSVEEVAAQLEGHIKEDINQRYFSFYRNTDEKSLFQGDVIEVSAKLKRKLKTELALMLSNTCDMQSGREKNILAIPLKPFPHPSEVPIEQRKKYQSLHDNVTKYANTTYFYLPPLERPRGLKSVEAMFGAFSEAVSVESNEMNRLISAKKTKRLLSLDKIGHYILMIKIAVDLLRPDDRFPVIK